MRASASCSANANSVDKPVFLLDATGTAPVLPPMTRFLVVFRASRLQGDERAGEPHAVAPGRLRRRPWSEPRSLPTVDDRSHALSRRVDNGRCPKVVLGLLVALAALFAGTVRVVAFGAATAVGRVPVWPDGRSGVCIGALMDPFIVGG